MPENMRIELDLIKFLTERVFKEFTKIFEFMKYIILYLIHKTVQFDTL
jgi:hypothetical protein